MASHAVKSQEQVLDEGLVRVRSAIAYSGDVPNRLAGGLASARSRLVAAMVPTITGPVFLPAVQALTTALGRQRLLNDGIPVAETWDLMPSPIDMLVSLLACRRWASPGRLPAPRWPAATSARRAGSPPSLRRRASRASRLRHCHRQRRDADPRGRACRADQRRACDWLEPPFNERLRTRQGRKPVPTQVGPGCCSATTPMPGRGPVLRAATGCSARHPSPHRRCSIRRSGCVFADLP
jgi:hypothetical protein